MNMVYSYQTNCAKYATCYDVFYSNTKVNFYSKKDETMVILCWFPTMWHLFIFVYDRFKAIHNKLNFIKSLIRNYILIFTTFIHFSRHNYNITLLFFVTRILYASVYYALLFFSWIISYCWINLCFHHIIQQN